MKARAYNALTSKRKAELEEKAKVVEMLVVKYWNDWQEERSSQILKEKAQEKAELIKIADSFGTEDVYNLNVIAYRAFKAGIGYGLQVYNDITNDEPIDVSSAHMASSEIVN